MIFMVVGLAAVAATLAAPVPATAAVAASPGTAVPPLCPPAGAGSASRPGCLCGGAQTSKGCPAGYRCSSSAAAALAPLLSAAGMQQTSQAAPWPPLTGPGAGRPAAAGLCVPCLLGEYCPEGTVEESWATMELCRVVRAGWPRTGPLSATGTARNASQLPRLSGTRLRKDHRWIASYHAAHVVSGLLHAHAPWRPQAPIAFARSRGLDSTLVGAAQLAHLCRGYRAW